MSSEGKPTWLLWNVRSLGQECLWAIGLGLLGQFVSRSEKVERKGGEFSYLRMFEASLAVALADGCCKLLHGMACLRCSCASPALNCPPSCPGISAGGAVRHRDGLKVPSLPSLCFACFARPLLGGRILIALWGLLSCSIYTVLFTACRQHSVPACVQENACEHEALQSLFGT